MQRKNKKNKTVDFAALRCFFSGSSVWAGLSSSPAIIDRGAIRIWRDRENFFLGGGAFVILAGKILGLVCERFYF